MEGFSTINKKKSALEQELEIIKKQLVHSRRKLEDTNEELLESEESLDKLYGELEVKKARLENLGFTDENLDDKIRSETDLVNELTGTLAELRNRKMTTKERSKNRGEELPTIYQDDSFYQYIQSVENSEPKKNQLFGDQIPTEPTQRLRFFKATNQKIRSENEELKNQINQVE